MILASVAAVCTDSSLSHWFATIRFGGSDNYLASLPEPGKQSGYPRDRGVYLARAAVAHMAAGDIEPAARLGLDALHIGVGTESGRILAKVVQLREAIDPASKQPGVGEFVTAYQEWKVPSCPDRT